MAELRVKSTGTLKLFESDNTSSVTIASPASLGADRTVTLPDGDVTLVAGTMSTGGVALATSTDNQVVTVTGADAITGETNLTFDGTDLTLGTGHIVFGTAAKGVYLGVTAATASNLLDDYEEGTHTYAVTSSGGGSVSSRGGYTKLAYTKVGRMVTLTGKIETSGTGTLISSPGNLRCSIPFTVSDLDDKAEQTAGQVSWYNTSGMSSINMLNAQVGASDDFFQFVNISDTLVDTTIQSDSPSGALEMYINVSYFTDS